MAKVKATVAELITSPDNLVGYQEIDLYMIFYINIGGNKAQTQASRRGAQDKGLEFNYIQLGGIARISRYRYTDLRHLLIQISSQWI